jgi:hypothetical protein
MAMSDLPLAASVVAIKTPLVIYQLFACDKWVLTKVQNLALVSRKKMMQVIFVTFFAHKTCT